jgi:hypothetical protein
VFGVVAKPETEIAVMIRRSLEEVGRATDAEVTAFNDGASGLRSLLSEAGCKTAPIADWFHWAMRLQHAKVSTLRRARHSLRDEDTVVVRRARSRWKTCMTSRTRSNVRRAFLVRSDPALAIYSSLYPIRSSSYRWPLDPPHSRHSKSKPTPVENPHRIACSRRAAPFTTPPSAQASDRDFIESTINTRKQRSRTGHP